MRNRILLVRNANSFDFGGGERYPINLALELKKNNLLPFVATAHTRIKLLASESGIESIDMPWLKYQNFSGWRVILTPLYLLWQIRLTIWYLKTIKKYNISILHLQSRDDFIAGTVAAKLFGLKVFWTDHADLKYIFKNVGIFYKNPIGKLVYRASSYATRVIVVSRNELTLIKESLGNLTLHNVELIYNGVTDRAVKKIRDFPSSTTIFVLSSRLVTTKGIGEIIQASRYLEKDGYNHKVLLVGEGPEEYTFKAASGESIIFIGYPDNALSYIAGADIFVHPTYNEAFSLSLVEAAMLGMPVITTRVGGNPEIIIDKKTGILIKAKDVGELHKAMVFAINDRSTMHTYGKNLRKSYEDNFRFDYIVKNKIIPLYLGLT